MRNLFVAQQSEEKKADDKERPDDPNKDRHVECFKTRTLNFTRRIKSELHLEESLPWHFEPGAAYHCFSFGDVDALTYLRAIIKQQRVEYAMLSTWSMARTDVEEIKKWMERGDLGRADFYVGELFQGSYADIYLQLSDLVRVMGGVEWPSFETIPRSSPDSVRGLILPWKCRRISTPTRAQSVPWSPSIPPLPDSIKRKFLTRSKRLTAILTTGNLIN